MKEAEKILLNIAEVNKKEPPKDLFNRLQLVSKHMREEKVGAVRFSGFYENVGKQDF